MTGRLLGLLLRLVGHLPWAVLRWLGGFVGWVVYRLNGREAHFTRVNLGIAFPHLDEATREQLVRDSLRENAITLCEMPRIWLSDGDLSQRVDDNGLPAEMERLAAQGRGLIIATPHHGNWEIVPAAINRSLPITVLYRPPRMAFLEPIMTAGRSVAQVRMVPTDRSGVKALHAALRNGEAIGMLPDQVPKGAGAAGIVAPFFGRDSMTMVLLGRLAARHASPVLFVWAERQADGRYRVRYFVADQQVGDRDPQVAASALNHAVERVIADRPAQYQWAYRRYRFPGAPLPDPYLRP